MTFWDYMRFRFYEAGLGIALSLAFILALALIAFFASRRKR